MSPISQGSSRFLTNHSLQITQLCHRHGHGSSHPYPQHYHATLSSAWLVIRTTHPYPQNITLSLQLTYEGRDHFPASKFLLTLHLPTTLDQSCH